MRVACILVHHLGVQVERARRAASGGGLPDGKLPLVIGGLPFEHKTVYDASPEAVACGVARGMPLSQASVLCPEACFLPADEELYRQVSEGLADLLEQYSPVVEVTGPGCFYIDLTGCESEPGIAREIATSIFQYTKLKVCCGIAANRFVARVGACFNRPEAPVVVTPGAEAGFVAPLPISFLPVSNETRERLSFLGIQHFSQVAKIHRESLETQFGEDGRALYRLSRGIDGTKLKPKLKPKWNLHAPAG